MNLLKWRLKTICVLNSIEIGNGMTNTYHERKIKKKNVKNKYAM